MAVKIDRTIGAVVAMARSASPMDSSERHWLYSVFSMEIYSGEAQRTKFINMCLEVDKNE